PVERQLRGLVRVVVNQILASRKEDVEAKGEFGRERAVAAKLQKMAWNARDVITRGHEDISMCVGKRVVRRRQELRELIGRIDKGIVHIGGEIAAAKACLGLGTLAQG